MNRTQQRLLAIEKHMATIKSEVVAELKQSQGRQVAFVLTIVSLLFTVILAFIL